MAVEIVMPRLSDSMEEGTILRWLVAVGDEVTEGAPLVEVETDKASVTYESEHDGTILELSAEVGASVAVGRPIAVIGAAGGPQARAHPARVKASPLARRIAAQLGVDLATLAGLGPQGRVVRADVEASVPARAVPAGAVGAAGAGESAGAAGADESAGAAGADESAGAAGAVGAARASRAAGAKGAATTERLSRLQQTVARRMSQSRATVPDFELRCTVDMGRAVELREQLRALYEQPPSHNDLIVRAAALALREFPRVNGSYADEQFERYERVNVGVAVAAQDALVVATIFDADRKSVLEIASESRALVTRVRDGSITPAEPAGQTFTISNLGMYGVDSFSAVINAPQAAILAVGSVRPRAVVDADGVVVARSTVELTLACDHRILYGADGARFISRVRELLEAPAALLL